MKKLLFPFLLLLIFSACSLDEDIAMLEEITEPNYFEDSLDFCLYSSPPITFRGSNFDDSIQLKKIISSSFYLSTLNVSVDSFIYDPLTQLPVEILKSHSRNDQCIFSYNQNLLLSSVAIFDSTQSSNDLPESLDSLIYDDAQNLVAIERFRLDETQTYILREKHQFNYTNDIPVSSTRMTFYNNSVNKTYYRYCWEDQNLIQSRSYDDEGDLYIETFREYDDKPNHNRLDPSNYISPSTWSKNNIFKTTSRSSVIAIESLCGNPCNYNFDYNDSGYPIEISDQSGFIHIEIQYN